MIQTVQISDDHVKQLTSEFVENVMRFYLKSDLKRIVLKAYPDLKDEKMKFTFCRTEPKLLSILNLGKITGRKNKFIRGWYGDFVIIINSPNKAKRVIIIEIKYGNAYLTDAQREKESKKIYEKLNEDINRLIDKMKDIQPPKKKPDMPKKTYQDWRRNYIESKKRAEG